MNIQLSLFDLLIIIGMVTGIVCSGLLFRKARQKTANRYLALGILGFVWLNTKTLLHSFDLWSVHGIGYFPNSVELALPPLFYFYFATLWHPSRRLGWRDAWHFLPFALSQTYAFVVYFITLSTPILQEKQALAQGLYFDQVKQLDEVLSVLSTLVYFYAADRVLRAQGRAAAQVGGGAAAELRFLKNLLLGCLAIVLYTAINLLLNPVLEGEYAWRWQVSHVLIATLVYYMALVGYKNSDTPPGGFTLALRKSLAERTDPHLAATLATALGTERVYLNPKLSLSQLAQQLGVSESALSQTIKARYGTNFRGMINQVRVDEVKRRLTSEGLGNLSLLGLAQECGFNSEASFYRVFKEATGRTPKQFLAQHSGDEAPGASS